MANAVFNANLTYLSADQTTLSQMFTLTSGFRAINAGAIPLPHGVSPGTLIEIPFGLAAAECRAVMVKNDTRNELGVRLNEAVSDLYQLAPGGVFFHWSPVKGGTNPLRRIALSVPRAPLEGGSVDYLVLGD
ncbi:MAG: hypothetical protein MUF34_06165 [Polyangiaceae bacterium]|jgi:hypothetical protein|nr:hypothetical protein [Polyangiaceae bacterium]